MHTRSLHISLVFLLFLNVAYGQSPYFPDTVWQSRTAAEAGMNKSLLDSAVRLAERSENPVGRDLRIANYKSYAREPGYKIVGPMKEHGGPAGLVIKNGYILAKWGDISRVDMTFSVTKSYLSTIAGLAVDQRLIRNITDTVSGYVWDGTFSGKHNAKITWEHLLNQSSDWSGTLFESHDWADRPSREGGVDDWKNRTLNEPGKVYKYNDVRVNLLAYSLLQVYRQPLPVVLRDKIMDPIGASTTWRWFGYENSYVTLDGQMMQSVSGGGHHGGGIFINTLDQARFGLLFLRNGKWKNQQLVSSEWVKRVQNPSPANAEYGYLWWLNAEEKWKGVSKNIYYAAGFGGNYIVIDQQHDLLIVTRWMDDNKIGELVKLVIEATKGK
ncbi:MAG: serine hydrolase [Gemmatimonadaceae bacterium]|nr:serine hydrolase [Chitinophagaceae bacterium]